MIGGLSVLFGMYKHTTRDRIESYLYEAAPKSTEIGAGVAFNSNSIRAMALLKLEATTAYMAHATFHLDRETRERKVWSSYVMEWMDGGHRIYSKPTMSSATSSSRLSGADMAIDDAFVLSR